MADLVGTCPKGFWEEWIAEGDAAGDPESGQEYEWHTGSRLVSKISEGDRFYIVAHGKLRGWAPVIAVFTDDNLSWRLHRACRRRGRLHDTGAGSWLSWPTRTLVAARERATIP